ncbi:hypothetical protein F1559_005185 [Cyanidiococcus yangmingshanensis]|uniref:Uncharacterized protein n=1 Tax=Cyanidiococcus yangmingshanensis TaxID=2690220 RepID=A0A7J7IN22_9RHOD|nr:hypothetical protein F1559_005185 [Cyanidiococcus yangmingshanensis]
MRKRQSMRQRGVLDGSLDSAGGVAGRINLGSGTIRMFTLISGHIVDTPPKRMICLGHRADAGEQVRDRWKRYGVLGALCNAPSGGSVSAGAGRRCQSRAALERRSNVSLCDGCADEYGGLSMESGVFARFWHDNLARLIT